MNIFLAVLPLRYDLIAFAVSSSTDLASPILPIFSSNSLNGPRNLSRIEAPPSRMLRSFHIITIIPTFIKEEPSRPRAISPNMVANTLTTAPIGAEILVIISANPVNQLPRFSINDLIKAVLLEKSRLENIFLIPSTIPLKILGNVLKFLSRLDLISEIVLSNSLISNLSLSFRNLPKDAIFDLDNSALVAVPSRPFCNKSKFNPSLIALPTPVIASFADLSVPPTTPNSLRFFFNLLPIVSLALFISPSMELTISLIDMLLDLAITASSSAVIREFIPSSSYTLLTWSTCS